MKQRVRVRILVSLYCLVLAAGIVLGALDLLGLLPGILVVAASGGLFHLGFTRFFDNLPDHLDELRSGSGRPRRES